MSQIQPGERVEVTKRWAASLARPLPLQHQGAGDGGRSASVIAPLFFQGLPL